jgi:hypothetical protein
MTFGMLQELAAASALSVRIHPVWPGIPRKYEEIRGQIVGRRVAQFPLVVLEKRDRS